MEDTAIASTTAYETPELTVLGTIADLTRGNLTGVSDTTGFGTLPPIVS